MTLEALKPKPDQDVIDVLRELLAKAEAGDVQQIIICASDPRDEWTTWYVGNRSMLVAGIERVKYKILASWG